MKTTRGIIPFLYNISDEEIDETIRKYHEDVEKGLVIPFDDLKDMSDVDLRPYAVNTILYGRTEDNLINWVTPMTYDEFVNRMESVSGFSLDASEFRDLWDRYISPRRNVIRQSMETHNDD